MSSAVTVIRPPRPAPLGRASLIVFAAFVSSAMLVRWLDAGLDTPLRGRLAAHERPVLVEDPGRILELHAVTGDEVRTGMPLLSLEDREARDRLADLREREHALRGEIERTRARIDVELGWRRYEVERAIFETEMKAIGLLAERVDVLGHSWSNHPDGTSVVTASLDEEAVPLHGPLATLLRNESARSALEIVEAQRELCEQRLAALRELRDSLEQQVTAAHGLAALEAERTEIESESRALADSGAERVIASPGYGTISRLGVTPGAEVEFGDEVVVVVDRARTFIELPVPSGQLERYPAETTVRVEFPGGERRTGTVVSANPERVVRRDESDDPAAETWFLLRVEPTGKLWPDAPLGTTLHVRPL